MGDYSAMQDEYREKNKERIKRQLDYSEWGRGGEGGIKVEECMRVDRN